MSYEGLRQVYVRVLARRTTAGRYRCIPPDELLELVVRRTAEGRRLELLDHVAGCGACLQEFELLQVIRQCSGKLEEA